MVKTLLSGIIATELTTLFIFLFTLTGFSQIEFIGLLQAITQGPRITGWLLHFATGIFLSAFYANYFRFILQKINSSILRGIIFGLILFLFAQIFFPYLMNLIALNNFYFSMHEGMMLTIESFFAHLIFGVSLVLIYESTIVHVNVFEKFLHRHQH
jgi:hypothetical protein